MKKMLLSFVVLMSLIGCARFDVNKQEELVRKLAILDLDVEEIHVKKNEVILEINDFEKTLKMFYDKRTMFNTEFTSYVDSSRISLLDEDMIVISLFEIIDNQIKLIDTGLNLDFIIDNGTKYKLKKEKYTFIEKTNDSDNSFTFAYNKLEREYFDRLEKSINKPNNVKKSKDEWIKDHPNDELWQNVVESLYEIYGED